MSAETDVLFQLIDKKTRVQVISGFFRGVEGLRATVDFTGGRVPAYFTSGYMPELNEPVWVMVADSVAYMLGPTVPKPADGVMVSIVAGIATVDTSIGTVTATYSVGDTFAAGDRLKLHWSNGCHILGVKSASPDDPDVPSAPGGGGRQTKVFTATDSGSYGNTLAWWTNDIRCSVSNEGAWFYGNKIRDTIPDTATIAKAEIYLPQTANLGSAPFGRHDSASKPAGRVTFHAEAELPARTGWVSIPTSLVDHLKQYPGGLGFSGGGNSTWKGTQKDAQSGALRITYDS